ncbi:hypothetical protein Cri9333_4463 [Crinalium epipsammum PCC 9333]|uniref:Uncharacterized protein n=1 Tax=Crinalium epipsammum PCC 9333 TaxID=1173022 RepID=K9W6Z3_9CYAN|nr:hypothetical protein [Crinalium epipsammum]AFZ15245.1 hypothetical protein Cri9333_4463 [Crinalium epipsammum PCC 9333]
MNKQVLRIAIALPMVIASANSSLANDTRKPPISNQATIDNIRINGNQQPLFPSTDTRERPKPKGPKGFEVGVQQTPNQQVLGNPANLIERPRPPVPGGTDPGLQQTTQQLLNLPGETRVRPKPKGPGSHDLNLQVVPQQQLQY